MNQISGTVITCEPFEKSKEFSVVFLKKFLQNLDLTSYIDEGTTLQNCVIVADSNIEWFLKQVIEFCSLKLFNCFTVRLDASVKSMDSLIAVWSAMLEKQPSCVIAIGGGTTCDIAGLAASTYHRGIPLILFPTTLLSMTDVSISGKTAIDYKHIKNSIGTIYYPQTCICILDSLRTLEKDHFFSAFSEMVKISVTSSREYFLELEQTACDLDFNSPQLLKIIEISCRLKAEIVHSSPNIRLYSLYGHVVGHALEAILGIRHGDAIAIGLNVEGYIAVQLGIWSRQDWIRQMNLLKKFSLPLQIPSSVSKDMLIFQMLKDEHANQSEARIRMVLPREIGKVYMPNDNSLTSISVDFLSSILDELVDSK